LLAEDDSGSDDDDTAEVVTSPVPDAPNLSVDKAKTSEASADDGNNTSAGVSDEVENVAPSNVEAKDDPEEKST
jgi:hypothetical protein